MNRDNAALAHPSLFAPSAVLQRLLGAGLFVISLPALLDLPRVGAVMTALAAIYALALLYWPRLWLLALPLVTVSLDLVPWTGRFLFSEYDGLILVTLASSLLAARYRRSALHLGGWFVPLAAYVLLYLAQIDDLAAFINPPGITWSNPYYSPAYSYKVGKGLVWATLLAPLWLSQYQENRQRTLTVSVAGVVLASFALFILALWERGTLAAIPRAENWWTIAHAFLNFSSDYRTTGIFSDMHTGGEVIDGLLILLLPLAFFTALRSTRLSHSLLALAAVVALCYVVVVGITRATWVAAACALVLTAVMQAGTTARQDAAKTPRMLLTAAAFMLALLLARFLQIQGGNDGVVAFSLAVGGTLIAGAQSPLTSTYRHVAVTAVLILASVMALLAHLSSRYAEQTTLSIILVPVSVLLVGGGIAYLSARAWPGSIRPRLRVASFLVLIPAGLATALGGHSFGARLTTVDDDLTARIEKWQRAAASAQPSPSAHWLGNGVGSFPRRYLVNYPESLVQIGSYQMTDIPQSGLSLGVGSDLAIVQRLSPQPDTDYEVTVHLLPRQPGILRVQLCRQNQLVFTRWRGCKQARIRYGNIEAQVDERGYEIHRIQINSGSLSAGNPLLRWPIELQIEHLKATEPADIRLMSLVGPEGELIRNGDFTRGSDDWFFRANFAHEPWYMTNLWLQAWFETGWLGFALLVFLVGLLGWRSLTTAAGQSLLLPLFVSVLCVSIVGLFGSPLDSARVSTWFYLLLFIGLLARLENATEITDPPAPRPPRRPMPRLRDSVTPYRHSAGSP